MMCIKNVKVLNLFIYLILLKLLNVYLRHYITESLCFYREIYNFDFNILTA